MFASTTVTWPTTSTDGARLSAPSVPLATQLDSSFNSTGEIASGSGGQNCGPASIAMVINYYVARHATTGRTDAIFAIDAANYIRGGAQNNVGTSGTNFGLDDSQTGQNSRALLAEYGLHLSAIASFDEIKRELGRGRPVILLVDNYQYQTPWPYENTFGDWLTKNHIVVVTGYDASSVYLNDPLRRAASPRSSVSSAGFPGDWAVAVSQFVAAATNTTEAGPWYGASVSP